jgi:integral membrane protein
MSPEFIAPAPGANRPVSARPSFDGRLRRLAFAEGASLLVLVGVAMPLKYAAGLPAAVRVAGLVHGLLFVLYVVAVLEALGTRRLSGRAAALAVAAAMVPGGTFALARRRGRG